MLAHLLRNRNFCIYFTGRSVSVIGDRFYSVALILAVLQATHSVTSDAFVLIAGTVPVVMLTLIGGTIGDRIPRNRVMLSSDLLRSAAQFVPDYYRKSSPLPADQRGVRPTLPRFRVAEAL